MDFRKHWDRWIWLIPAALILITAASLFFGREPFCAPTTEEHCLREWVSALAGWAAVAAGVPSILYLAKQVHHAERSARELTDHQLRRRKRITAAATRLAKQVVAIANISLDIDRLTVTSPRDRAEVFMPNLAHLARLVDERAFETFEDEVATLEQSDIYGVRRALQAHTRGIQRFLDGDYSMTVEDIDRTYLTACKFCKKYGTDVLTLIDDLTRD